MMVIFEHLLSSSKISESDSNYSTIPLRREQQANCHDYLVVAFALEAIVDADVTEGDDRDTLRNAAQICGELADRAISGVHVSKDHGDRDVMAFAILVSLTFKDMFGDCLPNQIAVIASIMFDREITGGRVRDWLRRVGILRGKGR